jgi:hypothetical protein
MSQFLSSDVQSAHLRLLDAITSWERTTGREITVVVIPHNVDDPIVVSTSGKPWSRDLALTDILQAVGLALDERRPPTGGG